MLTGVVKFFKEDKGYGFFRRDDGEGDVFFHIRELRKAGLEGMSEDEKASFEVESTAKGTRAYNIVKL